MDWEKRLAEIKEEFNRTPLGEIIDSMYPNFSDLPPVPPDVEEAIVKEIIAKQTRIFRPDPNFPLRNYYDGRLEVNVLLAEESAAIEEIAKNAGFNRVDVLAFGTLPLEFDKSKVIEAEVTRFSSGPRITKLRIEGYDLDDLTPFERLPHLREVYLQRNKIPGAESLATLEHIKKVRITGGNPFAGNVDLGLLTLEQRGVDVKIIRPVGEEVARYKGKTITRMEYHALEKVTEAAGVNIDDLELVDEISYHAEETDRLEVKIEGYHITGLKINGSLTSIPRDVNYLLYLRELALNCNKISGGRLILPHLEVLDVGDNEISDLRDFKSLFKLRVFYGFRNKIGSLEGLPRSVQEVYAGGNQISSLRRLFVAATNEPRIELDNLKVLDIIDNPIPSSNPSIAKLKQRGVDVRYNKRQGQIVNGTKIGEYTIDELISDENPLYCVYCAVDSEGQKYAIKVKKEEDRSGLRAFGPTLRGYLDFEMLENFKKLTGLEHPSIIKFVQSEMTDREFGPYLAMELIDNSRYERVDAGEEPYSTDEAASIVTQLASALALMHASGIERSFIEANDVYYDKETGMVKLADSSGNQYGHMIHNEWCGGRGPYSMFDMWQQPFGFSKYDFFANQGKKAELSESKRDVYALGLIFHDLLTGFKRETEHPIMMAVKGGLSDQDIEELGLPEGLIRIIQNTLSGDEGRTPDAATLVSELKNELKNQQPYSGFYTLQEELEELLGFDDQVMEPEAWRVNVELIQHRWLAIKRYVKQHGLSGYFYEELEKLEFDYKKREKVDLAEINKFTDTYHDRETALNVGLSRQDIESRLEIFWFWDMLKFLDGGPEAAAGLSKQEINSRLKLYERYRYGSE
jgi:Leucine-rich repeat (LRR) protein